MALSSLQLFVSARNASAPVSINPSYSDAATNAHAPRQKAPAQQLPTKFFFS